MPRIHSTRFAALAAAAIALTACSDQPADAQAGAQDSTGATAGTQPQPIALGLTLYQLADADLIGPDGQELGEVERVVRNDGGTVTGLIIEIEDSHPDRFVQIPLEGLSSVRTGDDDWDLQSDLTRDQLSALPDAAPRA